MEAVSLADKISDLFLGDIDFWEVLTLLKRGVCYVQSLIPFCNFLVHLLTKYNSSLEFACPYQGTLTLEELVILGEQFDFAKPLSRILSEPILRQRRNQICKLIVILRKVLSNLLHILLPSLNVVFLLVVNHLSCIQYL